MVNLNKGGSLGATDRNVANQGDAYDNYVKMKQMGGKSFEKRLLIKDMVEVSNVNTSQRQSCTVL